MISTKFGYELGSGRRDHSEGERPAALGRRLRARARSRPACGRLGTDHVDLYQLHNPRMDAVESDETFEALEALRAEGKLRHYGVALGPAIGWREEGLRAIAEREITSVQTVYNLLEQDPGRDLMAAAAEHGVGVMARVPTSSGLLDDNLTPETTFGEGDHRRHRPQRVARRGPAEDRADPLPLRARERPHDAAGGAALHPRQRDHDRDPDDHHRAPSCASTRRPPTCPSSAPTSSRRSASSTSATSTSSPSAPSGVARGYCDCSTQFAIASGSVASAMQSR